MTAPNRSAAWFADTGKVGFIARSHLRAQGHTDRSFDGRPVIGIADSSSDLNPCNAHLRQLATAVARGVEQAGGVPMVFPTISLGEPLMRPTTMLFRNLMAMDVEETLRANPLDGVVLLGGCDKTVPAQVMGAASVDLPAIVLSGGPMLPGELRGEAIGSGTDLWRLSEAQRGGNADPALLCEAESGMHRSAGHCMTMGTASTMAALAEALGLQLPGSAFLAAVDGRRSALAVEVGRRAVGLVEEDLRPSQLLTTAAFDNAVRVLGAIAGSTNAILHLIAIAGRVGVDLDLRRIGDLLEDTPALVDVKPAGAHLVDRLAAEGGLPSVLAALGERIDGTAPTVTGRPWAEHLPAAPTGGGVVRTCEEPLAPAGASLTVLHGNLAPDGAVVKPAAADPRLLQHRGPARVFETLDDYLIAAADPAGPWDDEVVIVLRGAGPRGYPGMPELGNLPVPVPLLERGIRDVLRLTDARMSGTAFGAVVLHVAPEAAVGGPLALVRDGDLIELDTAGRRLELLVPDDELAARRSAWSPPADEAQRGWLRLHHDHVLQADRGCDLDVLVGASGHAVPATSF